MNSKRGRAPDAQTTAMEQFFRDFEREMSQFAPVCRGCGECCHFESADHVLYASGLEKQFLFRNAVPPARPDGDANLIRSGKRCPFQADGRCRAREARPLGCRLFFCAAWPEPAMEYEFSERWHRLLKDLHDRLGADWDYGPLLPLEK